MIYVYIYICTIYHSIIFIYTILRRIGVREGSTKAILDHPFYANADLPGIYQKSFPAAIKPVPLNVRDLQPLTPGKKYDGEQKMFEDF